MPTTLPTFRIWAAAAWADGVMHPKEALALCRLLDRATDLDPETRKAATQLVNTKPDIDIAAELAALSAAAKADVYRSVIAIVRIDGVVTDDELVFVKRLRDQLGLAPEVVARLELENT